MVTAAASSYFLLSILNLPVLQPIFLFIFSSVLVPIHVYNTIIFNQGKKPIQTNNLRSSKYEYECKMKEKKNVPLCPLTLSISISISVDNDNHSCSFSAIASVSSGQSKEEMRNVGCWC